MEMSMTEEQREEVLDWLEAVDRLGPAMPLAALRCAFRNSPQEARRVKEYHYLSGLLIGRTHAEEGAKNEAERLLVEMLLEEQEAGQNARIHPFRRELRSGLHDGLEFGLGLL